MNRLSVKARAQILSLLCEGMSMRAISRVADCSINTVSKLLVDMGRFCSAFHDDRVERVNARRVQCDEVWTFTYAKEKNVERAKSAPEGAGDTWTWTAIDADSKLIISWLVGARDSRYAMALMQDLKSRLANRVQLTTDGHRAYLKAVEQNFGGDIDYAMLVKIYGEPRKPTGERKYSPPEFVCAETSFVAGDPDHRHISTSHAERLNLSLRMGMRRYTRLTNAFSKKFENHVHMVAIYVVWYNWIRLHQTIQVTPAMEAGLTNRTWDWEELLEALDKKAPRPKRGPYKKRLAVQS